MSILKKFTKEDISIGFLDSGLSITYRIGPVLHFHNLDMTHVNTCVLEEVAYIEQVDEFLLELDYATLAEEFSSWAAWSEKCLEEAEGARLKRRKSQLEGMDIGAIEVLADNLQHYVRHLYAIRASIQIGEQLDEDEFTDLLQDYEEVTEIKKMWDNLGEE